MPDKERKDMRRLHSRWMAGKATTAEMLRCMELDQRAEREARAPKVTA